jgi:hypothetical protein
VEAQGNSCGIYDHQIAVKQIFGFMLPVIIPPLIHTRVPAPKVTSQTSQQ